MVDCFISYRRYNSASLALLIQEKLKNHYGIDAYVDTTRIDKTKVRFPERLMKAIEDAPVFICLLGNRDGKHTLESEAVIDEIKRAYELRKFCIPIFQESYEPLSSPPDFVEYLISFDGIHVFDERSLFVHEAIDQIAGLIAHPVTNPPEEDTIPAPSPKSKSFRSSLLRTGSLAALVLLIPAVAIAWFIHGFTVTADENRTPTSNPGATTFVTEVTSATQTATPTATVTEQQTITPSATETEMPTASPTMEPDTETPTASLTFATAPPTVTSTAVPTIEPTTAVPTTIVPSLTAFSEIPTGTRMWATADPDRLQQALQMVTQNGNWHPYRAIQILPNGVEVEMVLVPAGCFTIGSTGQQHCFRGETDLFWIDVHEVYNEQYSGQIGGNYTAGTWQDYTRFPRDRQTWTAANNFCEWRGGRLPFDEEWEYAARGVDGQIYPWSGAGAGLDKNRAVYGENQPRQVGSVPSGASWVGAKDMIGNLREWTNAGSDQSPLYEVRGGSWNDRKGNSDLSTTKRRRLSGSTEENVTGFRCVLPYQTGLDKLVDFK